MASLARPCKENLMEFSSVYSSYVKERWFQSGGCSSNKRKRNRRKKNMRAETSCEYVNRLLTFIDGNFYIIKCVVFIKNRLTGFPSIIINACFDGSILSKLDFFLIERMKIDVDVVLDEVKEIESREGRLLWGLFISRLFLTSQMSLCYIFTSNKIN